MDYKNMQTSSPSIMIDETIRQVKGYPATKPPRYGLGAGGGGEVERLCFSIAPNFLCNPALHFCPVGYIRRAEEGGDGPASCVQFCDIFPI